MRPDRSTCSRTASLSLPRTVKLLHRHSTCSPRTLSGSRVRLPSLISFMSYSPNRPAHADSLLILPLQTLFLPPSPLLPLLSTLLAPAPTPSVLLSPISPNWEHDSAALTCGSCREAKFSTFTRKHHCRECGRVICAGCSRWRRQGEGPRVRVCRGCKDVKKERAGA